MHIEGKGEQKESKHSGQRVDDNADKRKNFLRFFLRNGIRTALLLLLGHLSSFPLLRTSHPKN